MSISKNRGVIYTVTIPLGRKGGRQTFHFSNEKLAEEFCIKENAEYIEPVLVHFDLDGDGKFLNPENCIDSEEL